MNFCMIMSIYQSLGWLLLGVAAGAGRIMNSKKIVIIGSFVSALIALFGGGFSFNIMSIIIFVAGACLVVFLARFLKIVKQLLKRE